MSKQKLILSGVIAALFSGQSIAAYQVQYGERQINGDNIRFVNAGNWASASPFISEWINSGAATDCRNWNPDPSTVDIGVGFTQNATDCKQNQTRTVQNREKNDVTQEFRNIGAGTTENQILANQVSSRSAVGTKTLDECSYVYGNSNTMSAWIYNDDNKNIEIWWKGVKIVAVKSSTVLSEYSVSGFKYVKSSSQIDRAKMDDNGHWYSYTKVCRTPL